MPDKDAATRAVLERWNVFQWIMMIALLAYSISLLYEYFKTGEDDDPRRDKLEFVHMTLLGQQGVVLYFFILLIATRVLRRRMRTFMLGSIK